MAGAGLIRVIRIRLEVFYLIHNFSADIFELLSSECYWFEL